MKLPFDNLLSFHSVVTNGSFSKAARKLAKSQSTISGAVKNLENELGYDLLERKSNSIELTSRGKKIFQLATPIVSKYMELINVAEALSFKDESKLRIGIDPLVFDHNVKHTLMEFSEIYPDTELTVVTKPSYILGQYINNHQIDIAIGNPYHKTEFDFNVDELFLVNCHWIAHKDFSETDSYISARLLLIDGSEDIIDISSIARHNIWVLDDTSTILELCLAKKGIAFLPQHLVENHIKRDSIMMINDQTLLFGRQIYASLIWSQHGDYSIHHQWLHDRLRKK